jgi:phosphatidylglycerophosphatase A
VSPVGLVAQFLWFRLFDILKPPPCRQGEQLPGGIGIVADDLIAGLYAILALWLTNGIYPLW